MLRLLSVLTVTSALALSACGGGGGAKPGLIGADCAVGRSAACASAKCLVLDSSTAYCTQACQAPADCPSGYLCAASPTGGTVCQALGAGGVCGVDDDCPAGLKCDAKGSHCYIPVTRSSCGPCTSDLQCGNNGVCHAEKSGEQFCSTACTSSAGCAAGDSCTSGLCLPSGGSCRGGRPLCAPCAGDLECGGPGDLCVRNLQSQETFCAVKCTASSDCARGFSCVDLSGIGAGPSQCVPDSGTCAGYCDASDAPSVARECGLGSGCDLTNHACVRETDGSLCAACATDDDCAKKDPNSRCVSNRTPGSPYLGERFCGADCGSTPGCTGGAGCVADSTKCAAFGPEYACRAIGTSGAPPFQCVPVRGSCAAGFARLGDSCEKAGPADCVSAICAQFGTEKRCSVSCTADADCGDAKWRCCLAVGSDRYDCTRPPTGVNGGICAPSGGSFGDDCAPGSAPCQEGLCLDLGTAQLCTRGCDATIHGCPAGFSCQSGTLDSGGAVKVCFPDGGGGVGSACAFGPAACQSHLCLKKDSGNVCTRPCVVDADCPLNWTCGSEREPDGTAVNVCLPPGVTP